MPRSLRLIPALLLLSSVALTACSKAGGALGDIEIAAGTNFARFEPDEREPAPSLAGEQVIEGAPEVSDEILSGKVAVVNFWGSWCGPCRKEEPILEAAHSRLGGDVVFVGVNTRRDQRAAAIAFLEEFDVSYPSVYDPSSQIAHRWGVRVMPATFILDKQGRIAAQVIGAVRSLDELEMLIEEVS